MPTNEFGYEITSYELYLNGKHYGTFNTKISALLQKHQLEEASPKHNIEIFSIDERNNKVLETNVIYEVHYNNGNMSYKINNPQKAVALAIGIRQEHKDVCVYKVEVSKTPVKIWPTDMGMDKNCSNCQLCRHWNPDAVTCTRDGFVGMRYKYMAHTLCIDFEGSYLFARFLKDRKGVVEPFQDIDVVSRPQHAKHAAVVKKMIARNDKTCSDALKESSPKHPDEGATPF